MLSQWFRNIYFLFIALDVQKLLDDYFKNQLSIALSKEYNYDTHLVNMFWPGKILLHYSYMAFWKNFKRGCIRHMIRVWAEERICKVSRGVWQEFMPHPFWCMIFYSGLFQNISRTTSRWGSSSSLRIEAIPFPSFSNLNPMRGS